MKRYIKNAVSDMSKEDYEAKEELATDPNASAYTLKQLAIDKNRFIRKFVAENPSTPAEVLKLLVTDSYVGVRSAVVRNPNVTSEILSSFVHDTSESVLNGIAISPQATDKILFELVLSDNKDNDNAFMVARSKQASAKTLTYIYEHTDIEDYLIMQRLARNPNTPIEIVRELSTLENETISRAAKKRLEELQK